MDKIALIQMSFKGDSMRFYFGMYTGLLQFGDPPEEDKKINLDNSWSKKRKKKCCDCEDDD